MRFGRTLATTCVGFGLACLPMVAQGGVIYVDADATGANNGSGWPDAYRELQSALAVAVANDEIWVAAGTYKPDYDVGSGTHTGSRTATFQFKNGVGLYGGFAGAETQRGQRDWPANVTILSGDLAGNDGPDFANNGENSYHVVTGSGTDATAIIDGFTIKGGNAHGSSPHDRGAGVYNDNGSPTIANNTITGNSAADGGGICCHSFCSPMIANNTITGNSAGNGGGIGCYYSSPTIGNNTITGNSAADSGGGMYCTQYSSPTIANNTITGNSANVGGGIDCYKSSPTIANTIVAFNSSGVHRSGTGTPVLRYNCVYGNTAYNYSGIADPTGTDGNISADPLFVDKDGGDYHLASGSPCIDAGWNADVPADTPDLDGDGNTTEPLPFDIKGNQRFVDDPATPDCQWAPGTCGDAPIVDMGAYELFVVQATTWRSVRAHGPLGDLPIVLDAAASGYAVGCEPRRFGMQRMEVDFNADVSGLLTGTVVAEDLTHGGTIAPTGQYTINGGMTLVIEFVFTNLPPLPEIAGLPDGACYMIDLAGHIPGLAGDTDCEFRVLAGDMNGTAPPYGDGKTDLTDMATSKSMNGAPVAGDSIRFDVNIDGKIDLTDMALVKSLNGGSAACP